MLEVEAKRDLDSHVVSVSSRVPLSHRKHTLLFVATFGAYADTQGNHANDKTLLSEITVHQKRECNTWQENRMLKWSSKKLAFF
jgi:hypothetical protein